MQISPPTLGNIGAEVTDIDITIIPDEVIKPIKALVYKHKLVVFRDQVTSAEQYLQFARRLGTPQIYFQDRYHHPDYPEIFVSSNVPMNGKKVGVVGTGRYWHTDYQFFNDPLPMTMVQPQQIPSVNRETYYIDMHKIYNKLPENLRPNVETSRAVHEGRWRYKIAPEDLDRAIIDILDQLSVEVPPVTHPAVITHPVTNERILYISEGFTIAVEGLSHDDNKMYLEELFTFISRDDHIHTHVWEPGDILLWDNRALVHKASTVPKGEPSVSYRIGVYDGLPFYV